ncbi:MAG TPA: DUF2339 domain-containing protein [Gemmatimonadales bacterium]|nr:DUF2339 domain-containing protein [Gemmatimonadales bacterium]
MSDEQRDALQRLERRVEVLEQMMRRLLPTGAAQELRAAPPAAPALATPVRSSPLPSPRPEAPRASVEAPDLEQWFGQRGLLVVGVLALLAATGFFLKYAIDRGWIAPLVRSLLAIIAGVAVAAWGEARIRRGLRRYGAAMIGAGGGLAYLGLWAAAGPYGLIERRLGVLLLAACTVVVILLALRHEVEGLAIWALAGAYLAPILLPPPTPTPEAFLGYLEVIGLGTGLLAYTMTWRRTFDLALAGYFLLAAAGASRALETPLGCWFLAAGALLTLHVTRRRPWPEARLAMVGLAWILLGVALAELHGQEPRLWLALAAAVAVATLLWWQELDDPVHRAEEAVLFVVNPFVLIALAALGGLAVMTKTPGLLPALLAFAYLGVGWVRRSAPHLIMGFALAAFALAVQADASAVVAGWTALALAALVAEQRGGRPGGRLAALGLAVVTFPWLFGVALWSRAPAAAAFTDGWALALYAYIAGVVLAARGWGKAGRSAELLWVLCAAAVFVGGSIELQRYFAPRSPLAADLALSVFWLVYAGALVWLGFSRRRKDVRSAGLVVAAGTGLKIVLYDLSNLNALYRIASFFALALIALAVAYAYNKSASQRIERS